MKKMNRNHIHMSTSLPEDKQGVISGIRKDAQVLIYLDVERSLKDGGVLWWISENGVVLKSEIKTWSEKQLGSAVRMCEGSCTLWAVH